MSVFDRKLGKRGKGHECRQALRRARIKFDTDRLNTGKLVSSCLKFGTVPRLCIGLLVQADNTAPAYEIGSQEDRIATLAIGESNTGLTVEWPSFLFEE